MVYAVCYYPASRHEEFNALGFDDSKRLTEERRVDLAQVIQQNLDWVGWAVQVIAPQEISANMFSRPPCNLNEMAHNATMQLIQNVLQSSINVTEIFVDPVGPSQSYKAKLSRYFPGIEITVEPHADALYPSVSAASICAKVTRDQVLQHWIWLEPGLEGEVSKSFGSGYPSDPNTVKWLDENEDPFFGFPSIIRYSWKTITNRMTDTLEVQWYGLYYHVLERQLIWTTKLRSEDEDEEAKPKSQRKRKVAAEEPKPAKAVGHHMKGRTYKTLCLESVNTL
ncbi:ribonuclease H-like domain-containing protein [Fennellomyces sp. T-0311]|nr:ribonuclease H-like domain-containing protein [Fennellomyces sp. T-0311]